jgi:hypothetical protein
MWHLFSLYMNLKVSACCYCSYLPMLLSCPKYPLHQPVALLFQNLCSIYKYFRQISDGLSKMLSTSFTYLLISGLITVHSPKRGEMFKSEILFHLFACSFVWLLGVLGLELKAHPFSHWTSYFCDGFFPDGVWRTTCLGCSRTRFSWSLPPE